MTAGRLICTSMRETTTYTVEICPLLFENPSPLFAALEGLASQYAIVTDDCIAHLYAERLVTLLYERGIETVLCIFPAGEQSKSRATKEWVEDHFLQRGWGREMGLIALGGGVVTDLGGYVAATYYRGIPHVLIPTSLMAMVDASIGGKTAVNVPQGKNLLGCHYPPRHVLIDPTFLATLPAREWRNGIAEMIKHAAIGDPLLFKRLEEEGSSLQSIPLSQLSALIYRNCQFKQTLVVGDERDSGKRHLLNFGHTVGHALEQWSHYQLSHGEAIAIGMGIEGWIAYRLGYLSRESWQRLCTLIEFCGLPLSLANPPPLAELWPFMQRDKKADSGRVRLILLNEIGVPVVRNHIYCWEVDLPIWQEAWQMFNERGHEKQ